jgi:O-acetylhomoserine/O-acetylserine sulfhydrylase-like pyridoxal-dependent enzyme
MSPTVESLQERLATLEGGVDAVATAFGEGRAEYGAYRRP